MLQTKHLHFECRCLFYCWCFCWCFIFWFCWVWGMSWQCWQKHGCSFSILYSIYFSDVFVSCFIVFVYCFVFWAADKIIGCSFSSLPAEAIQVVSSKSFIVLCLFSHFYFACSAILDSLSNFTKVSTPALLLVTFSCPAYHHVNGFYKKC